MKKVIGVLVVIIAIIILALSYYGLFAKIEIGNKETGPFWLVYEKHIGDYSKTGAIMDKVFNELLNDESIKTTRGFGLYYDNPKNVEEEKLRSIVGCILEDSDEDKVPFLEKRYNVKKFPQSDSIVAQFPFKGMLSILVGVFKVYPKLGEYIERNNYPKTPIMELYDITNEQITYIASSKIKKNIFDSFLNVKQ